MSDLVEHASDSDEDGYEPDYEIETVSVDGGRIHLHVLSLLPPPLEFMSTLHSQRKEISGRQVWTGSLLLANLFCQDGYRDWFENKQVLELGSGTGLLGMSVAKMTQRSYVTLTDGDPLAIDLLQQNLNNADNQLDLSRIHATTLLWSEGMDQNHEFCSWCRNVWSKPDHDAIMFDCIVAGDVLYKGELPTLFFATAKALLSLQGVLYLCHVPRAGVDHDIVIEAAAMAGFTCEPILDEKAKARASSMEGSCVEDILRAQVYRMALQ